jgi:hypothetical protein
VFGVEPVLLENVPPAPPSLHIADTAPPPKEPPRAADVPPWHMAAIAPPTFTVGLGFTTIVLLEVVVPQGPPLVVSTKVAVPEYAGGGVQVAFKSVALGLNVPPAVVLQVPPVAPPPTEPPKFAEVPPWQMAVIVPPTFTVGLGFTAAITAALVDDTQPVVVFRACA